MAVYRFGQFVLDPASFRLRRDGASVPLTPKAFEILALLVRERQRAVTKQELLDAVWPDTAVTENTLTRSRSALHAGTSQPGMILSASGAHDDAMRAFQRAREYAPEVADGLALLRYGYARQGRTEEARRIVTELRRWSEKQYVSPYPRAAIHVALGEWPQALADLEQAYDDRSWLVGMLKVDPMFDLLRGDERFERLVRRLNLTDEQ